MIPSLRDALAGVERLAVLGVGSELRGDDFAGVLVARAIEAWCKRSKVRHVAGFPGGSAPENLTGAIAQFKPTHLLLVDAAHLGLDPGSVALIPPERVSGASFSTHMLPAPIFLDYLQQSTGCRSLVLGIEPTQTEVLGPVSKPVAQAVAAVVATIRAALRR